MKSFKISLSSINDVKNFVNAAGKQMCDIDIVSGRYIIDAKSRDEQKIAILQKNLKTADMDMLTETYEMIIKKKKLLFKIVGFHLKRENIKKQSDLYLKK